ncbi:MAG: Ig-like domain-containing protein, partial [Candidatus Omnitrophota bacterium]|nr:Ig-like domain-containing protein [Candidatus Omnitrophota bacterium]
TINSGKMYADSGNVTLNLSATDDKGVTAYYASEDSDTPLLGASGWVAVSSTTSYSANISYTLSTGDGNKYVYAWYKDAARNISDRANTMIILDSTLSAIATSKGFNSSDSQSSKDSVSANSASDSRAVTYSSDTSAPSGGLTINTSSPTKNKTISVGLSATDNVGVTGYYLYDCKATEIISAPKASESGWVELNFTIPVIGYVFGSMDYKLVSDGNNEKTVYVWYKDAAGNVSNKSTRKITLDTTAPTITITSPTSDAKYKSSSSTISLSGSAAGDTKAVTWSNDKGESGTASGITSWLITGISLLDGTNTITVTATDTAGNSASDTLAVTYSSDTSAPSGGLTIHTSSPTKNRTISVSLSATDSVGVAGYYLYDYKATEADRVAKPKATDGGWTDLTTVATAYGQGIFKYKLVSPGNNKKTVFVWFKDAAGNVSGKSTGEIKLDK